MNPAAIVIFSVCGVANLFIFTLAFRRATEIRVRLFFVLWSFLGGCLLFYFVFATRNYTSDSESYSVSLLYALIWLCLVVLIPYGFVLTYREAKKVQDQRRKEDIEAAKKRSPKPPVRREKQPLKNVVAPRTQKPSTSISSPSTRTGISREDSDQEILNLITKLSLGHLRGDIDAPLILPNENSQLRAKGMTKQYGNWKECYFRLGRPFGEMVRTEVFLAPEPTNPEDRNAVMVTYQDLKLGYVPREYAPAFREVILEAGGLARAKAELWFDYRNGQKRNSIRLLVAFPLSVE